jgi:lipid-A-disaccharide synthase
VAITRSPVRIGIVAGEVSGDLLGAGLMRVLKQRLPDVRFEGIAGPRMQAEGAVSLYPMERLSLIGFEALTKLPGLFHMRRALADHFIAHPPDLFIGIDVPDFNLGLEERLKAAGIRTLHYVSPTVWAWRRWRIRLIRRAVDHMLTLFPFEAKFYRQQHVPVTFVGHPLADLIPDRVDRRALRRQLMLPTKKTVVALLPGSRRSELRHHAALFVETAMRLHQRHPSLFFVAPFVNDATRAQFELALRQHRAEHLPIRCLSGYSREAMAAADMVVLASGTATLEAALLRKPMVVTYRVSWLSYLLFRLLVRTWLFSLPNYLAGRKLVPELMQYDAVPAKLAAAVEHYLTHPRETRAVVTALGRIRRQLQRDADRRAADAVLKLLPRHGRAYRR